MVLVGSLILLPRSNTEKWLILIPNPNASPRQNAALPLPPLRDSSVALSSPKYELNMITASSPPFPPGFEAGKCLPYLCSRGAGCRTPLSIQRDG
jgi:hypothetical protein